MFDAIERLIAANEAAYLCDDEPDESDISLPPSGITMGMIRSARAELDAQKDVGDAVDYLRDLVARGELSRDILISAFDGSRARLSEAMNKKRGISLNQIRRLHFDHGLDATELLKPVKINGK